MLNGFDSEFKWMYAYTHRQNLFENRSYLPDSSQSSLSPHKNYSKPSQIGCYKMKTDNFEDENDDIEYWISIDHPDSQLNRQDV